MSSPDSRQFSDRRRLLRLAGLAPVAALGGCFKPLYGSPAMGGLGASEALRGVEVEPIQDRVGQQVRNTLIFGFTGGGAAPPPRYTLRLAVGVDNTDSVIDVFTQEPQVATTIVTVDYTLTPKGADKPVLVARNFARKSYERSPQRFEAVRAGRDAENNAAALVADEIRTRLAAYFAAGPV